MKISNVAEIILSFVNNNCKRGLRDRGSFASLGVRKKIPLTQPFLQQNTSKNFGTSKAPFLNFAFISLVEDNFFLFWLYCTFFRRFRSTEKKKHQERHARLSFPLFWWNLQHWWHIHFCCFPNVQKEFSKKSPIPYSSQSKNEISDHVSVEVGDALGDPVVLHLGFSICVLFHVHCCGTPCWHDRGHVAARL